MHPTPISWFRIETESGIPVAEMKVKIIVYDQVQTEKHGIFLHFCSKWCFFVYSELFYTFGDIDFISSFKRKAINCDAVDHY